MDCAGHLDITDRRFRELVELGVIERKPPGQYDLDIVRVQYIRHLRKVAAGRSGVTGELELSNERAKLAREQTETAALKNAISRGEYVAVTDVIAMVQNDYATVRQRLLIIAGKISDALAGRDRDTIYAGIYGEVVAALEELSAPAELAARAAEREKE